MSNLQEKIYKNYPVMYVKVFTLLYKNKIKKHCFSRIKKSHWCGGCLFSGKFPIYRQHLACRILYALKHNNFGPEKNWENIFWKEIDSLLILPTKSDEK